MIHIIQYLCPSRHAIFAVAYDPADIPDDVALAGFQTQIEEWIEKKTLNPFCGICGSRELKYEQRATKFKTMEEARPAFEVLEAEQKLARTLIDMDRGNRN